MFVDDTWTQIISLTCHIRAHTPGVVKTILAVHCVNVRIFISECFEWMLSADCDYQSQRLRWLTKA